MINRFVGVGRLVADPELKYTPLGLPMCKFRIAINRPFSNQQGEKEADFISCIAWRKQAENLANFMKKGNLIGLEGRIQTGSYEGQDGKRVYTMDVIADSVQFLEPKNNGQQQGNQQQPAPQNNSGNYGGGKPAYNNTPQQQYGGAPNYQQNQPPQNQQNYTRMDEDPFVNSKGPEISEDDLPFNFRPLGIEGEVERRATNLKMNIA